MQTLTRVIGLDLGSKRIGVALGTGSLATPYEVLQRSGDRGRDHRAVAALVEEAGAATVVVGVPYSLDGSVGPAAQRALEEIDDLAEHLDVPVETCDERLTTVTAEQSLREQGIKGPARREVIDKVAAAVILQAWLDARPAPRGAGPQHGEFA